MSMKNRLDPLVRALRPAAAVAATSMAVLGTLAHAASKTYTVDADFSLGNLSGLNFTAVANQLQLNSVGTTFPVMWVANAGEDTITRFDTVANREVARYRTWFGPSGPGWPHQPRRRRVQRTGTIAHCRGSRRQCLCAEPLLQWGPRRRRC
jgi:hypothetical protein